MNPELTIVITGAARGIGEATARRLAAAGHRVALGDLDTDLVQRVADEISGAATAAHLDVTSPDSWRAFLTATQELGPIDVLVNNAGIMPLGQVLKEPDEVTRKIFDVNVFGIINGTKAVGPGMVERGRGHIINVASAVGRVPVADGASYAASKFAAVGFSESTRLELKPHGIDVTVVLPGIVRTELAAGVPDARGLKSLQPEDVAEVIESAIRRPRPELWVPTWTRSMAKVSGILPLRVQEAIARAFKADRVMSDADPVARAAYEERARR
jgi:short-subunit dehydrogenase